MRRLSFYLLPALVWLAAGCSGPLGPFSGGRLTGETAPYPASWRLAAGVEQVQLETYQADEQAHSVNIWCVVHDERMYFTTSLIRGEEVPSNRRWVQNALANNNARVRVGSVIYAGALRRIEDRSVISAVKSAFGVKYDKAADERTHNAWIFGFVEKET